MRWIFFTLAVLCITMALPQTAEAKQLAFQVQEKYGRVHFSYQWVDQQGQQYTTKFTLFADSLRKGFTEFKGFNQKNMVQYLKNEMDEYMRYSGPRGVDAQFTPTRNGLGITLKGAVSQAQMTHYHQQIEAEIRKRQSTYLNNYDMTLIDGNMVLPDHIKITQRYITAMRPVAQALMQEVRGRSPRDVTNHVLNFVQSIPYDTLENRRTSNGAGFQTPYGVLVGNKGDCDSKAVMFIAIMKNIYPHSSHSIVYVPGHAFVGFDFAQIAGDYAVRLNGRNYVLAEPVGPGKSLVGELSERSVVQMRKGDYFYKELSF